MLHSEPNNWDIFKIPPVQPVQYYSILKKKREFSQLIKQYYAQTDKHSCLHYCSIVPKNICSSLLEEYELLIVFLGDVPCTSFIGFRVNVNSETLIHETNALLLFLKQSEKAGLYLVNNNCIHVQCGKDAWEIFYHLYGIYLRKYVLTIIGTQFFYHFVYRLCFQNEKQLLNMTFRGSKVIRVSKMSIYYRIHQKRKISVTDLIHMTLNMPENKRCVVSFDSKESLLHSNIANQNMYTTAGSKVRVSKLVINKFKKHYHDSLLDNKYSENVAGPILNFHSNFTSPEFETHMEGIENKPLIAYNSVQKRKFQDIEMDENEFQNDSVSSKYPKISDSSCLKEESFWEQYRSLNLNAITNYVNLLHSNCLVPDLFDNSKSSCNVDLLSNLYGRKFYPSVPYNESPSVSSVKKCLNSPTLKETCDIYDVQNANENSQFDCNPVNAPYTREQNLTNNSNKIINATNNSKESKTNSLVPYQKDLPIKSLPFSKSAPAASLSKHIGQGEANADEFFTSAAGKSINISDNAMLTARKFFKDMFQNETQQKIDRDVCCTGGENKHFIKAPALKKSGVLSRNYEDYIMTSGDIDSKRTNKDYELGVSYDSDGVSFSTAAGKTINVSEAAVKAAHKLILSALGDEGPSSSTAHGSGKKKSTFKDIGCPPKKLALQDNDNTMDKVLVENLFQDIVFDEQESESVTEPGKDFNKVSESKKINDPTTRRTRKSLGGRRSMRFYSDV